MGRGGGLPSLSSSSLTFLRLNAGFLRDSGYTHSPSTFAQRVQMGLCLSPMCGKSAGETGISRLTPARAPADGQRSCQRDGSGVEVSSHLSFRLRQLVQASGSVAAESGAPDSVGGSSGDVDMLSARVTPTEPRLSVARSAENGTETAPVQQNVRAPGPSMVFYVLSHPSPPNSSGIWVERLIQVAMVPRGYRDAAGQG